MTLAQPKRIPAASEPIVDGPDASVTVLLLATAGYLAGGKSLAYVGRAPLYLGEIVLITVCALVLARGGVRLHGMRTHALSIFVLLCGCQVLVGIASGANSLDSLRDFAFVYYSIFAALAYGLCIQGGGLEKIWYSYSQARRRLFVGATSASAASLFLVSLVFGGSTGLRLAGGFVVFPLKPTDASTLLFLGLLLWTRDLLPSRVLVLVIPLLLVCVAASRSVLLVAVVVLLIAGRRSRRVLMLVVGFTVIFSLLALSNFSYQLNHRSVSARQLAANTVNVVSFGAVDLGYDRTLQDDTSFRTLWWKGIIHDSANEEHLLQGEGWDTNLATKYGVATAEGAQGGVLRNPHNVFMGLLGRGGWLAMVLFAYIVVAIVVRLVKASSMASGRSKVTRAILECALVVIVAGVINGSTDVYLESPQNAIPFWVAVGVALATLRQTAQPQGDSRITGKRLDGRGQNQLTQWVT